MSASSLYLYGTEYRQHADGYYYSVGDNENLHRLYHRALYEDAHGRLPREMVVHHKDLDRSNNDLTNLQAMTYSEHNALHEALRPKVYSGTCIECSDAFMARYRHTKYCSDKCANRRHNRTAKAVAKAKARKGTES